MKWLLGLLSNHQVVIKLSWLTDIHTLVTIGYITQGISVEFLQIFVSTGTIHEHYVIPLQHPTLNPETPHPFDRGRGFGGWGKG